MKKRFKKTFYALTDPQKESAYPGISLRAILFFLLFQFFFSAVQGQVAQSHRKENFDVNKFREETISIAASPSKLLLKNMHGITVIDARADTAAVGFMQKKVIDPVLGVLSNSVKNQSELRINKKPTFIVLDSGLQQDVTQFTEQAVVFSADSSLPGILMVIKKLWLSDELNFEEQVYGSGRFLGPTSKDLWTSGVDVKIEFYLRDGIDYYPLYRYDSVISKATTVSEYAPEFIALALHLSVQKMKQMDDKIDVVKARRKFSLDEINRHNEDEFNMPVLKDAVLKKGVYMTFEEFKSNNPSQIDFELQQDKLTDILYIKQPNGSLLAARNIWGYCNGENAFIKSANNFFLLQRSANAFYIFGAKNIKRTETGNSGVTSYYSGTGNFAAPYYYTTAKTSVYLEPFQLDWSTGKLY